MRSTDMYVYKERLLTLRKQLRGDVHQMTGNVLEKTATEVNGGLSRMPVHMADVGSDSFERELTISLMETQDETLDQIETAIERIEDGTYGACEDCGARIPKTRLNAIPYATRCVKCASEREQSPGRSQDALKRHDE